MVFKNLLEDKKITNPNFKLIIMSIGVVIILTGISQSLTIIEAGEVGTTELFGKVSQKSLTPGIHLINPVSKIVKLSTRLKDIKEVIQTTSKEGVSVELDVSLQYRIDPQKIGKIYQNLGLEPEEIIVSRFRAISRQIIAQNELVAIYGEKREEIAQILGKKLNQNLNSLGFIVEEVLLRKIVLPQRIQVAIQEKLSAEQESQKLDFEIEKARKEAQRQKIEAQGKAEAQRILAEGLTKEVLQLKTIEATTDIARSHNAKIIIMGSSNEQVPVIFSAK